MSFDITKLPPKTQAMISPAYILRIASMATPEHMPLTKYTAVQIFAALDILIATVNEYSAAVNLASAALDLYRDGLGILFNMPADIAALDNLLHNAPEHMQYIFVGNGRTSNEYYPVNKLLTNAATLRNWTRKINKAIAAVKPVPVTTPVESKFVALIKATPAQTTPPGSGK